MMHKERNIVRPNDEEKTVWTSRQRMMCEAEITQGLQYRYDRISSLI